MRDIIAITCPGHHLPGNRAAMFLKGHDIGHQLAGMGYIREAIDDRHRRMFRQFADFLHIIGAQHDGIHIAGQHLRRIRRGFAPAKLHVLG